MTELPRISKSGETPKKPNLAIYVKPTPPKEYYRFRLLAFKSAKSDRDYPFITRFLHTVWKEGEDGKRHSESIVCPVTPFVKTKWNGDPMNDCPICRFANANFGAWKASGWKDKESAKKNREFGRKFEALIPVYVVNDPIYPTNNGHFKVFSFSDKDQYKEFVNLVQETQQKAMVFNGKNAVDFFIRFDVKEEVKNEGQPNEYRWKRTVIDRMGFTKPEKAYDIPAITKEAIDQFPFDETYYVANTMSELEDFYNRNVKVSNDDIPDEDEEIDIVSKKQEEPKVQKTNSIEKSEVKVDSDPVSDLPFDDGSDIDDVPAPKSDKKVEEDINDLLDDEEEEPKAEVAAPAKKEEHAGEILESPKDPMKTETSDEDLDKLLNDIL